MLRKTITHVFGGLGCLKYALLQRESVVAGPSQKKGEAWRDCERIEAFLDGKERSIDLSSSMRPSSLAFDVKKTSGGVEVRSSCRSFETVPAHARQGREVAKRLGEEVLSAFVREEGEGSVEVTESPHFTLRAEKSVENSTFTVSVSTTDRNGSLVATERREFGERAEVHAFLLSALQASRDMLHPDKTSSRTLFTDDSASKTGMAYARAIRKKLRCDARESEAEIERLRKEVHTLSLLLRPFSSATPSPHWAVSYIRSLPDTASSDSILDFLVPHFRGLGVTPDDVSYIESHYDSLPEKNGSAGFALSNLAAAMSAAASPASGTGAGA